MQRASTGVRAECSLAARDASAACCAGEVQLDDAARQRGTSHCAAPKLTRRWRGPGRRVRYCEWSCAIPGMVVTPGPGRSATPSTAGLLVGGMQKAAPSVDGCGMLSVRSPAGLPVTTMRFASGLTKAPAVRWLAQKSLSAAMRGADPVVKGSKVTGSGAWNAPPPISGGQSMLVV